MKKLFHFIFIIVCWSLPAEIFSQQWHSLPNPALVGDTSFLPVGVGQGQVYMLHTINNKLYIGGALGTMGGCAGSGMGGDIPVGNGIATFDGANWDSLGFGISGTSYSIEIFNGEIYVGGNFSTACSGQPFPNDYVPNTQYFAKWNGTQWLSPATPNINAGLLALKYNNALYIGGGGTSIGGVNSNPTKNHCCIFEYNGSSWNNMQGGIADSFGFPGIQTMNVYHGNLIAGGEFTYGGNTHANNIASWNGTKWDSLGSGVNGVVNALAVDTVKDLLYVGGGFTQAGGLPAEYYAVWNGSVWTALPSAPLAKAPYANSMKYFDGKIFIGTLAWYGDALKDTNLLYWDGNKWGVVHGPNEGVFALEVYKGNLYVGGVFKKIDTTTVNYIACYGDSCPGNPIHFTLAYGVHEYDQGLKFKIYPNPAKKEINIEVAGDKGKASSEKYIVRIKSSIGQEMFQQQFTKQVKIDTSQFPKGLCMVEVCTSEGKLCHTEKVVLQ